MMTPIKDIEQNEIKFLRTFTAFANKRVLEIGCGEGRLTRLYAKAPLSTIALDSDQDALRVALIDSPHDMRDKVSFLRAQAEHLPFSKNKFDLAILAWSF